MNPLLSTAEKNEQATTGQVTSLDTAKIRRSVKDLHPLSLPYSDLQGRLVQLFKFKEKLVGGILDLQGKVTVVPGSQIVNPLNPSEREIELLRRLERAPIKAWDLVADTTKITITILPHLVAAGKKTNNPRLYLEMSVSDMAKDVQERIERLTDKEEGALNARHLHAAAKETHKEFVSKYAEGKKHKQEVEEGKNSAKNIIKQITYKLNAGGLTAEERKQVEKMLAEAKKLSVDSRTYYATLKELYDPALKDFVQRVQANGLQDSYNASNFKHRITKGPCGKSIGGVGNEVGIIEGLFDTAEGLLEDAHYFARCSLNGRNCHE